MKLSALPSRQVNGSDLTVPLQREVQRLAAGMIADQSPRRRPLHPTVLGAAEKALIAHVVDHCRGNQVRAAIILGMNRNTLRERMERYGITWSWR